MLRIHTAYSSSGVKNYFSTADYYTDGPETVGFWHGKLCPELGLKAGSEVAKEDFGQVCDNVNPATGKRLTLRTNQHRRVGDDFIFSLDKELSVFLMLAPPEMRAMRDELLAEFQRHVLAVCDVMEGDVETRVRKDGAFENRPGAGMAFAGYLHTTARPVEGQVGDPQVHWHMFGFNATRDRQEGGRIKAADFAKIYRDSGYYATLFKSLVAHSLAERGLPVVRRADGSLGLDGLEWSRPKFSKRTEHIEDVARQLNITDAATKDGLGAKTRQKKDKQLSGGQLRAGWDSQLTPEERESLQLLYRGDGGDGSPAVTAREAVAFAIGHCSEKLSVIPERELVKTALLHGLGSVTPEMVEREMHDRHHGLVFDTIRGERCVTTQALQQQEREMADAAWSGIAAVIPVGLAEGLTRTLADGKTLNEEQWGAVTGLLQSPNRINLVQGPAGVGKSSLLRKYDEGMHLAGKSVTYLATTAKAAGVLQEDGFDCRTVASFLLNSRMQDAARGGRVVVDESSLLGHKDAARLLALGKKNNLKFVFVGDPMQHGSVSRGAFLRLLTEKGTLRPIRLSRILRQKDPAFRAAAESFAEGRAAEGFDALGRLGWVREIANPEDRIRHLAGDYVDSLKDCRRWQDVLVIAPTHAEAGAITDEIRSRLKAEGKLGEERRFERLVQVDTSQAQRGQSYTYRPGDVLVFHQNAKGGFTRGQRLAIADPAEVPLAEAEKFSVWRKESIDIAVGDVLRFTGTVQTLGNNPRVLKNGMAHAVAGFTEAGNIRLDSGDVIGKDAAMFRHGFVETSIGSQGRTVRRVLLGMSAAMGKAVNMQQLYVSATRAWEWVRVYADDPAAVREAAQRDSRQLLALDLKPAPAPEAAEREKRRQQEYRLQEDQKRRWYLARRQEYDAPPPRPPRPQPPDHTPPPGWRQREQERTLGHER